MEGACIFCYCFIFIRWGSEALRIHENTVAAAGTAADTENNIIDVKRSERKVNNKITSKCHRSCPFDSDITMQKSCRGGTCYRAAPGRSHTGRDQGGESGGGRSLYFQPMPLELLYLLTLVYPQNMDFFNPPSASFLRFACCSWVQPRDSPLEVAPLNFCIARTPRRR